MRVLGMSGYFHDAAAALVVDGQLVAAAQEERFTRRKHDAALPVRAAAFCLAQAGIQAGDLDAVVWHEKPFLKFERVLLTSLATFPRGLASFRRAMVSMVGDKLWVRSHLVRALGIAPERVQFSLHHASHAASAFLCSPFPSAAVLCVDGVGEWATTTMWRGSGTSLEPLAEIGFPHSIGLLYSVFTAFLGFEVNDGEYKIMGLGAFGTPRYREEVARLVRRSADGSFELDLDYFRFHRSPTDAWTPAFEALFGAPRAPDAPIEARHQDLAASIQAVTEELVLDLARQVHARTGLDTLCLAGGVALNAVAVGRLLREGPFTDVFVQPAAGDSGAAVGAALLGAGSPRSLMRHPAWGAAVEVDGAREFLGATGMNVEELEEDRLCDAVASRLLDGQVVGWVQGRFEIGPRALGHRSILADPRSAENKERLNRRVKFREPFRPFAPAVLAEASADLFDCPAAGAWTRRFMTSTVVARDDRVPAAVHVDGTARVQEVHAEDEPLFARLLGRFGEGAGVPCLVNTSFNLAGEPMVASVSDAWATFARSGIDALAVGPFLVTRKPG